MALLIAGHVSVILGLIGLLLPLVPTSPFMIIAAACYARSSERFYQKLVTNPHIGPAVLRWREHRCVERRMKGFALLAMLAAFGGTFALFAQSAGQRIAVGGIGLCVMLVIAALPTCKGALPEEK